MANANDSIPQVLDQAFQDIDVRANRIREWLNLDQPLRSVAASFDRLYPQLRNINGLPEFTDSFAALADAWGRCKDADLMDLISFGNGVKYINQTLTSVSNPHLDPKTAILDLDQLANQIDTALMAQNLQDFKQYCNAFLRRLKILMADRSNTTNQEVLALCMLTNTLPKLLTP